MSFLSIFQVIGTTGNFQREQDIERKLKSLALRKDKSSLFPELSKSISSFHLAKVIQRMGEIQYRWIWGCTCIQHARQHFSEMLPNRFLPIRNTILCSRQTAPSKMNSQISCQRGPNCNPSFLLTLPQLAPHPYTCQNCVPCIQELPKATKVTKLESMFYLSTGNALSESYRASRGSFYNYLFLVFTSYALDCVSPLVS